MHAMPRPIDLNLKWFGAVILSIVGALSVLPYLSSREADATMQALTAVAARERGYDQLLGYLTDAETGQRGYVITGDRSFLANYDAGLAAIAPTLATLRADAANAAERAALDQIAALAEQKLAELDETIELRRTSGFDASARVVDGQRGKRYMDSLRGLIGERVARLGAERLALRARMRATLGYNTV